MFEIIFGTYYNKRIWFLNSVFYKISLRHLWVINQYRGIGELATLTREIKIYLLAALCLSQSGCVVCGWVHCGMWCGHCVLQFFNLKEIVLQIYNQKPFTGNFGKIK